VDAMGADFGDRTELSNGPLDQPDPDFAVVTP
jgi:hypothetical protein